MYVYLAFEKTLHKEVFVTCFANSESAYKFVNDLPNFKEGSKVSVERFYVIPEYRTDAEIVKAAENMSYP